MQCVFYRCTTMRTNNNQFHKLISCISTVRFLTNYWLLNKMEISVIRCIFPVIYYIIWRKVTLSANETKLITQRYAKINTNEHIIREFQMPCLQCVPNCFKDKWQNYFIFHWRYIRSCQYVVKATYFAGDATWFLKQWVKIKK